MLHLSDTPLANVLLKPLVDCPQNRIYQEELDLQVDRLRELWDLESGLLTDKERTGREATAPLNQAAFCYHSPLSRHHGDTQLATFFQAGLSSFVESIDDSGLMTRFGLNGESWAHGWDVEGLIYGLHYVRDVLDTTLAARVEDRFRLSARRFRDLTREPAIIGSYGNQRAVWTLGMYLYSQVLNDPDLEAVSDQYFGDLLDKVLDTSGQVIEQLGPCQHYSFTAFIYAWLNLVVRGDNSQSERLLKNLRWFSMRFTQDGTPIAGPSTRQYRETMALTVSDLLPAAEQLASIDPMPRQWVLSCLEKVGTQMSKARPTPTAPRRLAIAHGHGTSPCLWSLLLSPGPVEPTSEQEASWTAPHVSDYKATHLLKRAPLRYVLIRQAYETHYNYTDFLPFGGLQTWGLIGEPPLLHPTPLVPTTTEGWALDTARHGSSHNWGLYGAGALGIDGYLHQPSDKNALPFLVSRHTWLWRIVVFTPVSTVIIEFGEGGPRRSAFTLNRLAPADPVFTPGVIQFTGRRATFHYDHPTPPRLESPTWDHPDAKGIRQLIFELPGELATFGLSDGSLSLEKPFHFTDSSGSYAFIPRPGWLTEENPGNYSIDTFQQTYKSHIVKLD